jgi:hypothetical protein
MTPNTTDTTTTTSPTKLTHADQARINGAKSKGPTSADGKARSSKNALKHGFAAKENIVIQTEDAPAWEIYLAGYRASFNPTNLAETDLVDQLASITWRQARLVATETALIDAQITQQSHLIEKFHPGDSGDPYLATMLAWQALARQPLKPADPNEPSVTAPQETRFDVNSLELCRRYQVSLDRQYRNVLLNLRQLRKDFANTTPVQTQATTQATPEPTPAEVNEPTPVKPQPIQSPEPTPAGVNEPTNIADHQPKTKPETPQPNLEDLAA